MYSAPYGFANPGGPAAYNTPPPQQMQQPPQQPPPQQMPPGSMPGQPNPMMYGQQFTMPGGQGPFMAAAGAPNMMGSPGPAGMMQNPGMPHMGPNGQMAYQTPYTGSPFGVGMPASGAQQQMPPNFNMMAVAGQMPGFPMNPQQQQAFLQQQQQQQQQQRMQPPQPGPGGMGVPTPQRPFNPMQQGGPMGGMPMNPQQQMQLQQQHQHQQQQLQQQQQQQQHQQQHHQQQPPSSQPQQPQHLQQPQQPPLQPQQPQQHQQPPPPQQQQQQQQPQLPQQLQQPHQSPQHPQQMQHPQPAQQAQPPQPFGAIHSPHGPPLNTTPNANQPHPGSVPGVSTPQTPTFPGSGGPMTNGVPAAAGPPLSPGSENREKELFSVLLNINQELLYESVQLRNTQIAMKKEHAAGTGVDDHATEPTEPVSEEEKLVRADYIQCMKRIQSNLSYLASLADRKVTVNAAKGPSFLSAPSLSLSFKLRPAPPTGPDAAAADAMQDPNSDREERFHYIKELYSKLQSFYPGVDYTKEPAFGTPAGQAGAGAGAGAPGGAVPHGMNPAAFSNRGTPHGSSQASPVQQPQRPPQMGMMAAPPGPPQGVPLA